MLSFVKKLLRRGNQILPFSFDKPLVVIQSDDWGRVGVRDKEGYEQLRQSGIPLGENPYDYYSLETAEDVIAVRGMLLKHRDSTGRPACIVMNFVMANLDFLKMSQDGFKKIQLLPLSEGLPGNWRRPGLFEAYRQGIEDRTFFPALHGLSHFNSSAIESALAEKQERAFLLRTLWTAQTPYIYWRMPWVGYEYLNPEGPKAGFLPFNVQSKLIAQAAEIFKTLFSAPLVSACAPGYRANADTHQAWARSGIQIAQAHATEDLPPYMSADEVLTLSRTIDFEPAHGKTTIAESVRQAERCFSCGIPAIVSIHSLNFHSSLKDFRGPTLTALDEFLSALEARHPNLLYVHDLDLYRLITRGKFEENVPAQVNVRQLEPTPTTVLES